MSEGFKEKKIDGLTVSWKMDDSGNGFITKMKYGKTPFVEHQLLNKSNPVFPFSLNREVEGILSYKEENGLPCLELHLGSPENITTTLYSDEVPIPKHSALFEYLDLFPYVYLCPWSQIHDEHLRDRFLTYEQIVEMKGVEGDLSAFFENLKIMKENGDRTAMEDESVKFICGADPYQGQFLSGVEELQSILKYYDPFGRWLLRQLKVDFESLSIEVEKRLGGWSKVIKCIESPDYKTEKERLWETFFALNITPGYDFKNLEKIIITLVASRMLERVVDLKPVVLPEKDEDLDRDKLEEDENNSKVIEKPVSKVPEGIGSESTENKFYFKPPAPEELHRWIHATILLPDAVFPLPPFKNSKNCESDESVKPSVIPYAIGELQMVQYRLRGYQQGEVSHIENILKGECKEVTERRFIQLKESELLGQSLQDERGAELEKGTVDFLNEVNRTLNPKTASTEITDYKTSYGIDADKNVQINGSWNVVDDPAGGHFEDKIGFAKNVVSRTVNRISQKVNWMRTKSSLSESEEKVMHRFDNTGGGSNVLGVYRWLNKVYSLRTVNRGNTLVLELQIEKPAASFLKNEYQYHEIRLEKPISPAELGLKDYKDVSESEGECYYLDFLARYDALELLPPPPQSRAVTAVLESAKSFCTLNCEVPEGYDAETARVSISFKNEKNKANEKSNAKVMVGNEYIEYSADKPPIELELKQRNLKQNSIPVSIMCFDSEVAENSDNQKNKSPDNQEKSSEGGANCCSQVNCYLANVEIECKRTDHLFREWQLLTFRKIMHAYSKQKAEYYQQIEHQMNNILPASPHLSRVVERQQLKRNAYSLLWNVCLECVGMKAVEDKQTSGCMMDKQKYFQFFRNSLEWEEMTYYLQPAWADTEKNDFFLDTDIEEILRTEYFEHFDFLNFLKASSARILLPVKSDFTFKFLYFLSSGLIWPGNDEFVPATSLHVPIVNEIKALGEYKPERIAMENVWEVILPTPMVVLQEDSHLPEVEEYFGTNSRRAELRT